MRSCSGHTGRLQSALTTEGRTTVAKSEQELLRLKMSTIPVAGRAASRRTVATIVGAGFSRPERALNMGSMELVEKTQVTDRPNMKSGDTIRVHVKVREGDKERIQIFEGMVIGMHRGGSRASFTVRKVSFGQGVERIFPLHSPTIAKVDVIRSARVRRAKLYFLRDLKGKAARMKESTTKKQ